MIARDIILFLLLNILPFIYLDWRYLHKKSSWGKRLLCWLPCVAMTAYTVYLAIQPNFIPDNDRIFILYGYLFLIGFFIAPRIYHRSDMDILSLLYRWQRLFISCQTFQGEKQSTTKLRQHSWIIANTRHLVHPDMGILRWFQQVGGQSYDLRIKRHTCRLRWLPYRAFL